MSAQWHRTGYQTFLTLLFCAKLSKTQILLPEAATLLKHKKLYKRTGPTSVKLCGKHDWTYREDLSSFSIEFVWAQRSGSLMQFPSARCLCQQQKGKAWHAGLCSMPSVIRNKLSRYPDIKLQL
jgi:hypothetical protein